MRCGRLELNSVIRRFRRAVLFEAILASREAERSPHEGGSVRLRTSLRLECALSLIAKTNGMAKIIAGGQSLGPMLNLRLVEPELIVDITGLSELKQAERSGDELVNRRLHHTWRH